MAYMGMAHIVKAYIVVICILMAYMVMAYIVMACVVMTRVVMACVVIHGCSSDSSTSTCELYEHIFMAYGGQVMALALYNYVQNRYRRYCLGPHSRDLHCYGLPNYGLGRTR